MIKAKKPVIFNLLCITIQEFLKTTKYMSIKSEWLLLIEYLRSS